MARTMGSRVSFLTERREELHQALVDTFIEPIVGAAFAGRVDATQPVKLAAPRVWIGDSAGDRRSPAYVASWSVWVAFDGGQAAQVNGVDEVVGRVIDAAHRAGFDVVGHQGSPLPFELVDTAKPNVRAAVVTIERTSRTLTLCTPTS